jgi:sRNA-binding regulator protein Hfq
MSTTPATPPRTIKDIALAKIREQKQPRPAPEPEAQPATEPPRRTHSVKYTPGKTKGELDRNVYGRCATARALVRFRLRDGSDVQGRVLSSSMFCVTIQPCDGFTDFDTGERILLYKHGILSVHFPAAQHPTTEN